MRKLRIKKNSEGKKIIWSKLRHYIDFIILVCCLVVTFNIHPVNENIDEKTPVEKQKMIYIFHDYAGNEYIMNDSIHWAADSRDYLFEDEIPSDLKWEEREYTDSVSLSNMWTDSNQSIENTGNNSNDQASVKDNQVSLKDMMLDLWVDDKNISTENVDNNQLIVDLSDSWQETGSDEPYYIVTEQTWDNDRLIIEKIEDSEYPSELSAKTFTFTADGWVLPILVSRDQLKLNKSNGVPIAYIDNSWNTYESTISNWSWVTIIKEYTDCMTPWWYKIDHGDSVLAYQQLDNAPNICNIERRFCRNGKLSWTYTQQWCSVNKNYTYEQWWEVDTSNSNNGNNKDNSRQPDVIQNPDWSVTVNNPLWTGSFVFDRPSKSSTPEYHESDNVKTYEEVDQTNRPHWDCTAPWWEKVKHGNFVQAFKHANWFADAPCEMQIRICTMWNLMWTYTESTCKTRDASFIDWVNWYPYWDKSSKEKVEWIKKHIQNEKDDYEKARKNVRRSTKVDELDKLLYILDNN